MTCTTVTTGRGGEGRGRGRGEGEGERGGGERKNRDIGGTTEVGEEDRRKGGGREGKGSARVKKRDRRDKGENIERGRRVEVCGKEPRGVSEEKPTEELKEKARREGEGWKFVMKETHLFHDGSVDIGKRYWFLIILIHTKICTKTTPTHTLLAHSTAPLTPYTPTFNHCLDGIGGLGYLDINLEYLPVRTLQLYHRHPEDKTTPTPVCDCLKGGIFFKATCVLL